MAKNASQSKSDFSRESVSLDYAQLSSMILKDLNESSSKLLRSYTKEDVSRFMGNPMRYAKELQLMSSRLYDASPHYKRIVNYFAHMAKLDYIVEPYGLDFSKEINAEKFRKGFDRASGLLDTMNIKHEFKKALTTAWKLDAFYGYEHVAKDSYFIQKLPNEYCQIDGIEDGVFTFSFNFKYFDTYPLQLEMFPKEFKSMYRKYKNGSQGQWQAVDPSKSVVIKINEEVTYDIPPFVGVFASIFDIEDYKALKKTKETLQNYKFLVQKIPLRDKSERNNDFLIDLNNVAMFHNKTSATLPEEIGLITSPMDVETVDFSKDKSEKNSVVEAERDFYSSTGTSQMLFNGDSTSQANLAKSITTDEMEVFTVLRQIERWVNKKMKSEVKGTYKFRSKILDITEFNKDEYIERLLKNAQYGMPIKMMLASALGVSPSAVSHMTYLENEVLGLTENFLPLSSSHTSSGESNDEGGRPESDEDDLSDKGEEQRDRDDNSDRE